jgi:hypothetical protein
MPDIDLRRLLAKYVWHIIACEGISFNENGRATERHGFTSEELKELQAIVDEGPPDA